MQRYAKFSGDTVVFVVEQETAPDPGHGVWVACSSEVSPGFTLNNGVLTAPAHVDDPWKWYIDIGPFTDRFGLEKFAIDMSTDAFVIAFIRDLGRRKWVDLKGGAVKVALNYLAGHTIPSIGTIATPVLTDADVSNILNTPVRPDENLALRKQFFS